MDEDVSCDELLGGRLKLRQPLRGHRAGTDAILLAAATPDGAGDVLDLGAGVGTAGLAIALRDPSVRLRLVERDSMMAALAAENIVLNGLHNRASVVAVDALSAAARRVAGLSDDCATTTICNPPFYDPTQVRASPDVVRAAAHVAQARRDGDSAFEPWMRAIAALTRPSGRFVLIHQAEALGDIMAACAGRFGALAVRPVHPRASTAAHRILVTGLKGSRAPLRLLEGLSLHEADGRFTPLAEAIHRGEAQLDWT